MAQRVDDTAMERLDKALEQPLPPHPRLFLSDERLEQLRRKVDTDPMLDGIWRHIHRQADALLDEPAVEREQVGRRLLPISREVLKRVSYLAMSYKLTGKDSYAERAEKEMLAAAGFRDWNPDHFLDVAEMTAALAIGYDWLHEKLDAETRRTIREAIISKGLQTSFDHAGWWVTTTNNWSQVCHGGLTLGALAVFEHEPEIARRTIIRAMQHIHRPMDVYGPNGAYPEGPGYWAYGTVYNVMFIDALATALGNDFGLSEHEPFMASARYYLHVHGPTSLHFNYSDNGERAEVSASMFWFARKLEQPQLLWMERRKLESFIEDEDATGPRTLPLMLAWSGRLEGIDPPQQKHYRDDGDTPIGIHRGDWSPAAVYIGLKAGTPQANHGQMDIGSFVMDAEGVRWAVDLGKQDYHSIERAGLNLWDKSQDSDRWRIFRLNNRSKNTLVVDDQLQRVDGFAPITSFSDDPGSAHTVIDMTEVYDGQLAQAHRGVRLIDDEKVQVQDEVRGGADERVTVRWGMLTRAAVEIVADDRAVLQQDGRRLGLRVLSPQGAGVKLETYETADPPGEHDAPNPGTRMIGFKVHVEAGQEKTLAVLLEPGGPSEGDTEVEPLDRW